MSGALSSGLTRVRRALVRTNVSAFDRASLCRGAFSSGQIRGKPLSAGRGRAEPRFCQGKLVRGAFSSGHFRVRRCQAIASSARRCLPAAALLSRCHPAAAPSPVQFRRV